MHIRTVARCIPTAFRVSIHSTRRISFLHSFFGSPADAFIQQSSTFLSCPSSSWEKEYSSLVQKRPGVTLSKAQLTVLHDNITKAMKLLSETPKDRDFTLLKTLFHDAQTVWDFPLSLEHHRYWLKAMISVSKHREAKSWLLRLVDPLPQPQDWNELFMAFFHRGEYEEVVRAFRVARKRKALFDSRTYSIYIRSIFEIFPPPFTPDRINSIRHEASRHGIPIDETILSALMTGFERSGDLSHTFTAAGELLHLLRRPHSLHQVEAWNALVRTVLRKQGRIPAMDRIQEMKERGIYPASHTFLLFAKSLTSPADLKQLEADLGIRADAKSWAAVISNVMKTNGIRDALSVFEQARTSGVVPSAAMAHPVLKGLCFVGILPPRWANVERAMGIYRDLYDIAMSSKQHRLQPEAVLDTSAIDAPPLDEAIYAALLRALTASSAHNSFTKEQREKSFSLALGLLADMRALRIRMSSRITTSILALLMRLSGTYAGAFKVYRAIARHEFEPSIQVDEDALWDASKDPPLDQRGFEVTLNTFCTLELKPSPTTKHTGPAVPPPEMYFEIVKDMQERGFEVTAEVYRSLLHRFGMTASKLRLARLPDGPALDYPTEYEDFLSRPTSTLNNDGENHLMEIYVPPSALLTTRQNILAAIRYTHHHLTLSPSFTPDTALLNTLMNAYNRVGSFSDAIKVWDTLRFSQLHDPWSVSIVLDTCGWARQDQVLLSTWNWLDSRDWKFNDSNWHSLIEALCRVGRLHHALQLICLDEVARAGVDGKSASQTSLVKRVPQNPEEKLKVDVEAALIILKFSLATNKVGEVKSRIKRYLPTVWDQLQHHPKYRSMNA